MTLRQTGDPETRTRIEQFELAFRMQASVPELTNLASETEATFRLYGEQARNPGSFAKDVGIAQDDILVSINRQPVDSVEDVKRVQNTLKPGDPVVFHVMRSDVPAGLGRSNQNARAPKWTSLYLAGTMPNTQ